MHHPGVEAAGHGEGLEVAPQGHGQRQLVHQVHGRAGHHCAAAQVLQAEHCREGTGLSGSWTPGKPARLPASLPGTQAALSTHCAHAWPGAGPEKGHPALVTWDWRPVVSPSRPKKGADLEYRHGR